MSQTLYRFFNGDTLLYVGISVNAYLRAKQHSRDSRWWEEATHVTFEKFETRQEVEAAETEAILQENPKYNIAKRGLTHQPYSEYRLSVAQKELLQWLEKNLEFYVESPQAWLRDVPASAVPPRLDSRIRDLHKELQSIPRYGSRTEEFLERGEEVRRDWLEWWNSAKSIIRVMSERYAEVLRHRN